MLKEIHTIYNFNNYGHNCWTELIKLGYIIYQKSSDQINVLDSKTFETIHVFQILDKDVFLVKVLEDEIYFLINNKVFLFGQNTNKLIKLFESSLQKASILSKDIFLGVSFKKTNKLNKLEIINHSTGKTLYSSEQQNYLFQYHYPYCIFKQKFSGTYFLYNLISETTKWMITIDDGFLEKRFYDYRESDFMIQRKVKLDKHSVRTDVQNRDFKTGKLNWELKGTLDNYIYLPDKDQYIGVEGERIHHFSCSGDIVEDINLDENLSIQSQFVTVHDNYLLFSAHLNNMIPVIGIVDVRTYQLQKLFKVFVAETEYNQVHGLQKPFVFNNNIYVVDSLNRLRIFELEKP